MKNLRISKKLTISYAVVLALLMISIMFSVLNLRNIGKQVETFYNGPFVASSSANLVNTKFEQMQKSVYRAVANSDINITNEAIQNAKNASTVIAEELVKIQEHFLGDATLVTTLQSKLTELAPMREAVLAFAAQNKNAEAAQYMEKNNIPTIKAAQESLDAIIETATQKGEDLIQSLQAAQMQSLIILTILGISSIIISVAFAVYITRGITQPVAEIEAAAENLSQGKLDSNISYHSKDELGRLSHSMRESMKILSNMIHDVSYLLGEIAKGNFNVKTKDEGAYVGDFQPILLSMREMNNNLSDTIGQINRSADQVSAGSEQVSSGAQALSQGATEQASSVEELAATITEISQAVKKNADNAQQASQRAGQVGDEMVESNMKMQQMIKAMDEISHSSGEIGKIIKTIEDIAFQTNILALNAAVEAARAGAAGKGFAVVADEVRNLASKSAEASKNTSTLIETSIKAVENGTRIADDTAKSLLEAVEGVKEVTETVNMISSATEEQACSIEQVTQGVDQISSVVQTNSATAEESAAASEELSGQAQMLKSLVGRFRLKETGPASLSMPEASALPAATQMPLVPGDFSLENY